MWWENPVFYLTYNLRCLRNSKANKYTSHSLNVMLSTRSSVDLYTTRNVGLEKVLFPLFVVGMLKIPDYVVLKLTVLLPLSP